MLSPEAFAQGLEGGSTLGDDSAALAARDEDAPGLIPELRLVIYRARRNGGR